MSIAGIGFLDLISNLQNMPNLIVVIALSWFLEIKGYDSQTWGSRSGWADRADSLSFHFKTARFGNSSCSLSYRYCDVLFWRNQKTDRVLMSSIAIVGLLFVSMMFLGGDFS